MPGVDDLLALGEDCIDGDTPELARRYRLALEAGAALRQLVDDLSDELAARMEADQVRVPGVGMLERKRERRSTWLHEHSSVEFRKAVGDTAVNRIALDVGTGELDPVRRNIGRAVVDLLWEYVPSFSSVKAAGKRDGIDVDQFRTTSYVERVELSLEGEPA
jgi:hypothetical protein